MSSTPSTKPNQELKFQSLFALAIIKSVIKDMTDDEDMLRGKGAKFFLDGNYIEQCKRAGLDAAWLRKQAAQLAGVHKKHRKKAGQNLIEEIKKRAA
jgi:hypothetical protein